MKEGLLDFAAHNFELVYGTTINKVLSKANRLIYGASEMTHAMVLTGANVDEVQSCFSKVMCIVCGLHCDTNLMSFRTPKG